jgi:exonuclease III
MTFNVISKIISWNIQSSNTVTGSKFDDPLFCDVIKNYPIICLQETRQPVKYPGFRTFNKNRRDNKHGGVCIMIQNEIARGVKLVKSPIEDVVACKLDKTFFGLENDIFIVNAYIKPANSSSKNSLISGLDTLHELDSFLNTLLDRGGLINCGDFNARIGRELDYIEEDRCGHDSFVPPPDDYIPQNIQARNSKDINLNSYKRPFLDMLINNKLHVLNGRTLGDSFGEFTCIQTSGASVVDYFIISQNCHKYVRHMTVHPFTCFSDHKPIVLALDLKTSKNGFTSKTMELHEKYTPAPRRYKTSTESSAELRSLMTDPDLEACAQNILQKDYPNNQESTYRLNEDITKHLQCIGDKCLQKTSSQRPRKNKPINKQPWFTPAIREAKQSMLKATDIVSNFPGSDYLRKNFYRIKNTYKNLVNRAKNSFFDKLNSDIESGKILNWKQFKKLKKMKGVSNKFDCYDMAIFQEFFSKLCANDHTTISTEQKQELLEQAKNIIDNAKPSRASSLLDQEISIEEISSALGQLKTGKSPSDDMICNEIFCIVPSTTVLIQ